MAMPKRRPIVGIPCDVKSIAGLPFHAVGEKYIDAVRDIVGALPILLPVTHDPAQPAEILALVDGLLLTGSHSNVHPQRYGGAAPPDDMALDTQRDATTLSLIPAAIEAGVPLFGICRGLQELNVALGGTIEPAVHLKDGRQDHREDPKAEEARRYGPAHAVKAMSGGLLQRIAGAASFEVNSLHAQAIDVLAPPLVVEAKADDGTIEAVSAPGARGFVLAVQWHPEWRAARNTVSVSLFEAFRRAIDGRLGAARGDA